MKSIESPRKKVQKAFIQMEPKRAYEHQRDKDPTEKNQEAMSKSCAAHQRTPSPHPNGKPKGSEGLAQPDRRHFSAQQKALNSAHEPKRILKIFPSHYCPHRSSP